jgi:hypothetical protein
MVRGLRPDTNGSGVMELKHQLQLSPLMKLRVCHSRLHTYMLMTRVLPSGREKHLASLYWTFSSNTITQSEHDSNSPVTVVIYADSTWFLDRTFII